MKSSLLPKYKEKEGKEKKENGKMPSKARGDSSNPSLHFLFSGLNIHWKPVQYLLPWTAVDFHSSDPRRAF